MPITRRQLLQIAGTVPFAAPLSTAFGQGRCRDGYGRPGCPLTADQATAPIPPVFAPTGWRTVALDHLTFDVADYRKEATFYTAVMGWTLRADDGKQAVLDVGDWGSVVLRQAPAVTFESAGRGRGRGGGPVTAIVQSFCFVVEPWNAGDVERALRQRGMNPIADHAGQGFESFHVVDPDGFDLQIANGRGLAAERRTRSTAKLSEPLPFAPTGWKTIWLDHLSYGAADYKKSVSFYTNLLGWKESYDEGSQNELMIGDVGDIIVRGGNRNDPNFGSAAAPPARTTRIDHISWGISPWDTDGVKVELEKRGLVATVDTSSTHPGPDGKMIPDDIHTAPFRSYHTRTPNGYNLQISWMTRDKRLALANAVKPKR